jgi:hypothetical protein
VQFHLTYEGLLLGSSRDKTRADHKHEIRRVFHKQLKRLWDTDPWLSVALKCCFAMGWQSAIEPYRFVPLVRETEALVCSLNVLFLRPVRDRCERENTSGLA